MTGPLSLAARLGVLVAVAVLVPVAGAHAATVKSFATIFEDPETGAGAAITNVQLVGSGADSDNVAVTYVANGVRFESKGEKLDAAGSCTQDSPHQVTCGLIDKTVDFDTTVDTRAGNDTVSLDLRTAPAQPAGGTLMMLVLGGAGMDTLSVVDTLQPVTPFVDDGVWLDGGADADTVTGGADGETLIGGSGADTVSGGAGPDTLFGDTHRRVTPTSSLPADSPADTGPDGNDTLDGGADKDTVSYEDRAAGVGVDLAAGTGGHLGTEADKLTNIENATGSAGGSDTLLGTDGNNVLNAGEQGKDTVDGRGGDDFLTGNRGVATGGPGNDTINGIAIAARCGAGIDLVTSQLYDGPKARVVPRGCERAGFGNLVIATPLRAVAGKTTFAIFDASGFRGGIVATYRGKVVARLGKRPRQAIGANGKRFHVALTAYGRRTLRRHKQIPVRLAHGGWFVRLTLKRS